MTVITNTYTVTISDAHSHSVQCNPQPGNTNDYMLGKLNAVKDALTELQTSASNPGTPTGQLFAALVATDTITITVTQP